MSLTLSIVTTLALNRARDRIVGGTTGIPTSFDSFLQGCWLTFFPAAVYVSVHHILNQTWALSRCGPPVMDLVQYAHSPISLLPFLALNGVGAWLLLDLLYLLWLRHVANGTPRVHKKRMLGAIVAIALFQVPTSWLNHVTLALAGPGAHAGQWLAYSAATGDQESIEQLAQRGIPIDTLTQNGQTALVSATIGNSTDIVKYLLTRGANVPATTPSGESLLGIAADQNNPDIARLLLARGATFPCSGSHVQRLEKEIASRDTGYRFALAHADSLRREHALRSDSMLASWAAARDQAPLPCKQTDFDPAQPSTPAKHLDS